MRSAHIATAVKAENKLKEKNMVLATKNEADTRYIILREVSNNTTYSIICAVKRTIRQRITQLANMCIDHSAAIELTADVFG